MKISIITCFCIASLLHSANATLVEWSASFGGNGHFYEVVYAPDSITWTAASNAAVNAGGYLATITSSDEDDFVMSLIDDSKYWNVDRWGHRNGPWLGGYNPSNEFVWVTGEPFTYSNWGTGQPNGVFKGVIEDKLRYEIGRNQTEPTWHDERDNPALWDDLFNPPANVRIKSYVVECIPEPATLSVIGIFVGGIYFARRFFVV